MAQTRRARSNQESPMKFRAAALATALWFAFSSVAVFAQSNDSGQSTPPPATTPAPPSASTPAPPQTPAQPQPAGQSQTAPGAKPTTDTMGADPGTVKHGGGKNDVDAIGNRSIGGKGMGNWYSIEKEVQIGKQYAQQVEASVKLVQDPVVNEYVNRVGQNLVRNSDAKVPFTIKVVDSDVINAMALPGGFFYVNSGLILAADDEAELAGVMAHRIAHVAARHTPRQLTRSQFANYMSLPLIFIGGGIGLAAREAAGIGLPVTFLKFSRSFEAEADYLGIQYMYKAGYDPNEFVNFFEKIQAQEKKKPGSMAKVFADHPQTPDRIAKSQEEIATILPAKDQYVETTSEFNDIKARLAAIENRHKVDDSNNPNKPSLRRQGNSTAKDGDKKDDDRPTLKRRDQ